MMMIAMMMGDCCVRTRCTGALSPLSDFLIYFFLSFVVVTVDRCECAVSKSCVKSMMLRKCVSHAHSICIAKPPPPQPRFIYKERVAGARSMRKTFISRSIAMTRYMAFGIDRMAGRMGWPGQLFAGRQLHLIKNRRIFSLVASV